MHSQIQMNNTDNIQPNIAILHKRTQCSLSTYTVHSFMQAYIYVTYSHDFDFYIVIQKQNGK